MGTIAVHHAATLFGMLIVGPRISSGGAPNLQMRRTDDVEEGTKHALSHDVPFLRELKVADGYALAVARAFHRWSLVRWHLYK